VAGPPSGIVDPIFFGLLEAMAFLLLFCSPFLAAWDPSLTWSAVAVLRGVVFGAAILPAARAAPAFLESGATARFLLQGCLYQIPFWVCALFFPLQAGQGAGAVQALLLQSCLLGLLPFLASSQRLLGAESYIFLLSLSWMLLTRPRGEWLILAVLAFPLTLRVGGARRTRWAALSPPRALALGFFWLAALGLPRLAAQAAGELPACLLLWSLLLMLVCLMQSLQEEAGEMGEVAESLPALRAGQAWRRARDSAPALLGWVALLGLQLPTAAHALGALILLTCWCRGVELSARNWFTAERQAWWVALEATLLWLSLRLDLKFSGLLLLLCGLYALGVRLARREVRPVPLTVAGRAWGDLERTLSGGLMLAAPAGLAARILRESDSVELDATLTASAPVGFRERLLQRLRQAEDESE
jgi:hypothetical protein